jgi:tRNA (guanine-N7-)-methyltransferase
MPGEQILGATEQLGVELDGSRGTLHGYAQHGLALQHPTVQLEGEAVAAKLANPLAGAEQHAQRRRLDLAAHEPAIDVVGEAHEVGAQLRQPRADELEQGVEQGPPVLLGLAGEARPNPARGEQDLAQASDRDQRAIEALDLPALARGREQIVAAQLEQHEQALQRVAELVHEQALQRPRKLELGGEAARAVGFARFRHRTHAMACDLVRSLRQHVNPLGAQYLEVRAEAIERPPGCERLEVELGCADAQFSFELARRHPSHLVVGLEIREALVARNRERAARLGLANLAFGYVNINVDLDRVFAPASVDRFHVLFPDPWFKTRHRKRRVVELGMLEVVARQLRAGGELHFASDVFELALAAMVELEHDDARALGFTNMLGEWRFARQNPCEASSRREDTTLARGQRVWRMRYIKQ